MKEKRKVITLKSVVQAITTIFGVMCLLFCKSKAYAGELEKSVTVPDGYAYVIFNFTFAETQQYEIDITSPSGELTHAEIVEQIGKITVDAEEGRYTILIKAPGDVKVSLNAEMKRGEVAESTKDISVSSAITGLNAYFSDSNLYLSWDDTISGSVTVKITDPTSLKVIYSDKITSNSCVIPMTENVSDIDIFLCPTNSINTQGAGMHHLINVVKTVPGFVTYPDKTLVSDAEFSFDVNIEDKSGIKVYVNNSLAYEETFNESGTYHVDVPLYDLVNEIKTYIIDPKNNSNSYSVIVTRDITAPKIKMGTVEKITQNRSILIEGQLSEESQLFINDSEIPTDDNRKFIYDYYLDFGDNTIVVSAIDKAGNKSESVLYVTRQKKSLVPIYVLGGLLVIVLLSFLLKGKLRGFLNRSDNKIVKQPQKKEKPVKEPKESRIKSKKEKPIKTKASALRKGAETDISGIFVKRNVRNMFADIFAVGCAVVSVLIITYGFFKNTIVASGSMEPTLSTGSLAFYNKLAYVKRDVQRGDIICFYSDELGKICAKRCIGIAGDEIEFRDGYVILNGELLQEDYIDAEIETNSGRQFVVPENSVFVLGDNRENSLDSRFWNNPYISTDKIYGKYICSFVPFP